MQIALLENFNFFLYEKQKLEEVNRKMCYKLESDDEVW